MSSRTVTPPTSEPELGLELQDLLVPFGTARTAAVDAARSGNWLDAFLLTAGCAQVVEDRVHASGGFLDQLSTHLAEEVARGGWLAPPVRSVAHLRRLSLRSRPASRQLLHRRDVLSALTCDLAAAALDRSAPAGRDDGLLRRLDHSLGDGSRWGSEIDADCLRLPSCFRSFDQHPADVVELVARFCKSAGSAAGPVLVAGVRTSGSYLGPLAAAELRRRGHRAQLVTLRPGERLDRSQRDAVRQIGDGPCLVIDDPPVSGAAVQGCIDQLVAAGVPADAVVLLLALPEEWPIPERLLRHQRVVLGSDDWHVTAALAPDLLGRQAECLLARSGRRLDGPLVPVPHPVSGELSGAGRTRREHRCGAYAITISGGPGPAASTAATLVVQGVGVGLFGRHDTAVASRLGGVVPEVLGVADGLLYQLVAAPGTSRPPLDVHEAVGYVSKRHRTLARPTDRAATMAGRRPAWEVAAQLVGQALGRGDGPLRLTVVQPLVRQLLRVDAPSVVDGLISTDRWVAGPAGPLVKLDFAEGAFSNRDLWSYDPVLDLAAVADELAAAPAVRAEWERQTGRVVEPSRWLLLRLVHAWDRRRLGALSRDDVARHRSAALADFVGELLLADLRDRPDRATGGWCALDVDGVLETGVDGVAGGASAPGWDGGMALRALVAHGHRVVLATGRGADDTARRRAAWDLVGAVAEYGAGLVLPDGRLVDRRDRAAVEAVERARCWLAQQGGVVVDPGHRFAIRAWHTGDGSSSGVR